MGDYRDLQPKLELVLEAEPHERHSLQNYQRNARRLGRADAALVVANYVLSKKPRDRMLENLASTSAGGYGARRIARSKSRLDGLHGLRTLTMEDLGSDLESDSSASEEYESDADDDVQHH